MVLEFPLWEDALKQMYYNKFSISDTWIYLSPQLNYINMLIQQETYTKMNFSIQKVKTYSICFNRDFFSPLIHILSCDCKFGSCLSVNTLSNFYVPISIYSLFRTLFTQVFKSLILLHRLPMIC